MQTYIDRFITRMHIPLHLQQNLYFEIIFLKKLQAVPNFIPNNKSIQLYHSIIPHYNTSIFDIVNSIEQNGFYPSLFRGNKGRGIYFANHSRYSLLWAKQNVLICDIIADEQYINRYKSEIMSGSDITNSEYVISNSSIIYPKYFLQYKINNKIKLQLPDFGFVPHGNFGCNICDKLVKRCDCKQYPIIDKNDYIFTNLSHL
jgi:hypothetical protein